jgi:hypothetical protein
MSTRAANDDSANRQAAKQPTHGDLAEAIGAINSRLDAIDAKLTPISELYTAGKVGGSIFKWFVGVLAGVAGLAAFLWGAPK